MRILKKLLNPSVAKPISLFLKYVCYFVIAFYILCLILSFMGRLSFFLHTDKGSYEYAIFSEENHGRHSRTMTISTKDNIHVWTDENGKIDFVTHIGLSLMYAVQLIPLILGYWFLSLVFSNISRGKIFVEQNALYLLYFGLIQLFVSVIVPFCKLLICHVTNLLSDSLIRISTGQNFLSGIGPGIAFIVAAYIIHYGIYLQDEVDHTI